jgi:hypothetical protein
MYLSDIDECANNISICGNYGQCNNLIGSYNCECMNGYRQVTTTNHTCEGKIIYYNDLLIFIDIDECIEHIDECDLDAKCMNTLGDYYCECPTNKTLYTSNDIQHNHSLIINRSCIGRQLINC